MDELSYYEEGYNKGYEDAIDKVCEWLRNNIHKELEVLNYGITSVRFPTLIENLRKAMEE